MKNLFYSRIIYILIIWSISGCATDEPELTGEFVDQRDGKTYQTIIINSTRWMAENLNYQNDLYSYQQALQSCPDGWKLASDKDWKAMCEFYGGYLNWDEEIGNSKMAYNEMIKSGIGYFNAAPGDYFWTGDLAFDDAPTIRSTTFHLRDDLKSVVRSALLSTGKLRCRCVEKEILNSNSIISFEMEGEIKKFDFYPVVELLENGFIEIRIHEYLLDENDLLSRIFLYFEWPGDNQKLPFEINTLNFAYNFAAQDGDAIGEFYYYDNNLDDISFQITLLNEETVEGTFSIIASSARPYPDIKNGTFLIDRNNTN